MISRLFFAFLLTLLFFTPAAGQDAVQLTLEDAILRASEKGPTARMAKLDHEEAHWTYKAFQAGYKPSLSLFANAPGFLRSLNSVEQDDGSLKFVSQRRTFSSVNMSIQQPISLTGGTFSVSSGLSRILQSGDPGFTQWQSSPLLLSLNQPLFQFNAMKWDRRVTPIQYEADTRAYVEELAELSTDISNLFFAVYDAKQSIDIESFNVAVNDTIFTLAQGRYDIGIIAENELLQTELQLINARTSLANAQINHMRALQDLKIALGLSYDTDLQVIPPFEIPSFDIDPERAIQYARTNRPDYLNLVINSLLAERNVEQSRKSQFGINMSASYGLNQSSDDFDNIYVDPLNRQQFGISFQVPIFQWGRNRSQLKAAIANKKRTEENRALREEELDQVVYFQVLQLELLEQQVRVAAQADTIAARRFEVARNRYLVGNIDITDLFNAQNAKDSANRSFINTLRQYWTAYYDVRRLTLYDFEKEEPLGM
ncbi:MAG: TolC family protein [Rhodothermales bacterium]